MKKLCLLSFLIACTLTVQAQFRGGSGTKEDPYLVADGYDLADIANYRTSHFKQIADIDLSEWIADNAPQLGWMPIGTYDAPFQGSFDGGNFTIRGLVINRPTMSYIGLFGYVQNSSSAIQNIVVESPDVTGGSRTGAIIGYSEGKINNCHITSAKIKGATNVGGLVGVASNTIANCSADISSLTSSGDGVGGISGYSNYVYSCQVKIASLMSMGNYVGGITGLTYNDYITSCQVSALKVEGKNQVGGIVGYHQNGGSSSNYYIKNNLVIINELKGIENVGGIVGLVDCGRISGSYAFANINSNTNAGGICGYSNNSGQIENCCFDGTIIAKRAGGVLGYNIYMNTRTCLVRNASISGKEYAAGIVGFNYYSSNSYNVENSVSLASRVISQTTDNAYRITNTTYGKNNKAFNQTELYQSNKKVMTITDNAQNGVAYGEKTLMRSSSYTGLGWDFNTVWTIQEGESYPYLQIQSDYPVVTDITSSNKAILKGTCKSNGKLTIINNGAFVTTPILDNKWEADLGAVNHGDTLYVYAQAEGKMPSVVVRYVFNESSVNPDPQGIVGDANGDGVIDSADVTAIINFILGKPSASFNRTNADVNGDGEILIDDAVQTVQLIMDAQ